MPKLKMKDFAKRLLLRQPESPVASKPAPITATAEIQNRALSVRQPYAEQIMRGVKTIEYRSKPTHIRGRIYIYASLTPGREQEFQKMNAQAGDFPTGVIIGSVEVFDCTEGPDEYNWHLAHPIRLDVPFNPQKRPQPSWFIPFEKDK
jgi:hypothetical protein